MKKEISGASTPSYEEIRTVEMSETEQVHLITPSDLNSYGRLFGGRLMQWIDEVAGIAAIRHAGCPITTAAVDNLQFKEGAGEGDLIVLRAWLTYVGNTSMEVRVDTYVEDMSGKRRVINRAYLVEVAVDEDGQPLRVPRLKPHSPEQYAEGDNGLRRQQLRKERREEGY